MPRSWLSTSIFPSFLRMKDAAASSAPVPAVSDAIVIPTIALPERVSRWRWWSNHTRHGGSVGRATFLIFACALLSLGIYLSGMLRFPLAAYLSPPPLDIGKMTSSASGAYSPLAGKLFLLSIVLLFGAWGLACWVTGHIERLAQKGGWRMPWLLGGTFFGFPVVALLVLLWMYPVTAIDVFMYTSQIRVLTIYHSNPLTISPSAFPQDPFLPLNTWPTPVPYGPLWVLFSALVSQPAGNHFLAAVIAQKLLSIAACLGCMALVWLLAKRLCPQRRWQAVVFFAWNPLVLFETGTNGHNDAIMVFFLLAGLAALLATHWSWQALALPLLVASVLVKWTSVLLIPLALIYLLRGGRARRWGLVPLGIGTALSLALAVPVIAPFWDTHHPWAVWQQAELFTSSPPALLHTLLASIYIPSQGHDVAANAVHLIGLGTFALVYGSLLVRLAFPGKKERLEPEARFTLPQRLIATSFASYFWYFVLAAFWFQPWYLLALVPLAALDPRLLARLRGALFSLGAGLSYVIYIFVWLIAWRAEPVFTIELAACFSIYALPLLTWRLESWLARQRLYKRLAKRPGRKPVSASKGDRLPIDSREALYS
jgi:alpha-1,6-mannosyltransferase